MILDILSDGLILKAMGAIIIALVGSIVGLIIYYWNEHKATQKDVNIHLGDKIDSVTNSLNMFIEETVSLKKDVGDIKISVATIHRDVISLEHRVEKHGLQIDNLKDRIK